MLQKQNATNVSTETPIKKETTMNIEPYVLGGVPTYSYKQAAQIIGCEYESMVRKWVKDGRIEVTGTTNVNSGIQRVQLNAKDVMIVRDEYQKRERGNGETAYEVRLSVDQAAAMMEALKEAAKRLDELVESSENVADALRAQALHEAIKAWKGAKNVSAYRTAQAKKYHAKKASGAGTPSGVDQSGS